VGECFYDASYYYVGCCDNGNSSKRMSCASAETFISPLQCNKVHSPLQTPNRKSHLSRARARAQA
jgi:hypothetical protein